MLFSDFETSGEEEAQWQPSCDPPPQHGHQASQEMREGGGTDGRRLTPLFCFRLLHSKDWLSFMLPILKRCSLLADESRIFHCFVHRGKLICHHDNLRCFALHFAASLFATYDCSIRKNLTVRLRMHRNALFEAVHNFSSFFHFLSICHLFSLSVMTINDYEWLLMTMNGY